MPISGREFAAGFLAPFSRGFQNWLDEKNYLKRIERVEELRRKQAEEDLENWKARQKFLADLERDNPLNKLKMLAEQRQLFYGKQDREREVKERADQRKERNLRLQWATEDRATLAEEKKRLEKERAQAAPLRQREIDVEMKALDVREKQLEREMQLLKQGGMPADNPFAMSPESLKWISQEATKAGDSAYNSVFGETADHEAAMAARKDAEDKVYGRLSATMAHWAETYAGPDPASAEGGGEVPRSRPGSLFDLYQMADAIEAEADAESKGLTGSIENQTGYVVGGPGDKRAEAKQIADLMRGSAGGAAGPTTSAEIAQRLFATPTPTPRPTPSPTPLTPEQMAAIGLLPNPFAPAGTPVAPPRKARTREAERKRQQRPTPTATPTPTPLPYTLR